MLALRYLAALLPLAFVACDESPTPSLSPEGRRVLGLEPRPGTIPTPAPEPAEPAEDPPIPEPPSAELPQPSYLPLTKRIHDRITSAGSQPFEPYTETVPLARDATIHMVPIKGGTFTLGTPQSEPGRKSDEGPQVEVAISPFWMAETEITWDLYRAFMENGKARNKDGTLNRDSDITTSEAPEMLDGETEADVVSQPTPPYVPMHFEMGEGYAAGWPAIAMTQHAASKFCEWLSAQTGHYYRLPTEAEWEYAARAGTTTPWSFGDDPSMIGDFAWTMDNADYIYQKVGQKKPNPWGLHDMHGNVAEWTLDAYLPDAYAKWSGGAKDPWHVATERYPRVARGGSYYDGGPETMRSGSRIASDPSWKAIDPQNPKSIWYHTSNPWIGFRIVRPLEVPSVEQMHLMWNTGPGPNE